MSLGFDCGTSRFRAVRRDARRLIGRQTPTAYTAITHRDSARRLMCQARIPCCFSDDALLILGADADAVADAMQLPLIPLLPEAHLPEGDPVGRQVASRLFEMVVPRARQSGEPASVVLPGDAGPGLPTYEFFVRLLRLQGYDPRVIPATLAIALAELSGEQFTGICVSLGAGGASLGLIARGALELQATTEFGGDWIDLSLMERFQKTVCDPEGRRFLDRAGIAHWKAARERSLTEVRTAEEEALRGLYRQAIRQLLERFRDTLPSGASRAPNRRPLPVVLHGGPTVIDGFLPLWEECWHASGLDLPAATARLASHNPWAAAQGCLIDAELRATAPLRRCSA